MSKASELAKFIGSGEIARTSHPAFLAVNSTGQTNISLNTENTIVFENEIFDQGGDFASNTFTAPVTGRYQLNTTVWINNIDTAATYYSLRIRTSNRDYFGSVYSPSSTDSDVLYWQMACNVLADMDAGDTAIVTLFQPNGTAQTDISGSGQATFSGYLVC